MTLSCLQLGADVNAVDNDGWSPLALVNSDRERIKNSLSESVHWSNLLSWWEITRMPILLPHTIIIILCIQAAWQLQCGHLRLDYYTIHGVM